MPGCNYPTRIVNYCSRKPITTISAIQQQDWHYLVTCSRCPSFSINTLIRDDALMASHEHYKQTHTEGIVRFIFR